MSATPLDALLGAKVIDIVCPNDQNLIVITNKGDARFTVVGDCCSQSYLVHQDDLKELVGQTVKEIEELGLPGWYCPSRDSVRAYGFKITGNKSVVILEFRNDSNGYYGGWIEQTN